MTPDAMARVTARQSSREDLLRPPAPAASSPAPLLNPSALDASCLVPGAAADGRVLLLSMRRLAGLVAYSMTYEFEDVITQVTGADRVEAGREGALEFSRRSYKFLRYATGSRGVARALAPPPSTVRLERDYELFFPTFNHAYELFALAAIPGWRKHCRVAACFVSELWPLELPTYLLELLSEFDHIFLGVSTPVAEVARIAGRPCSYLPIAADVLRFSPYPEPPPRVVDVCNIGRRSEVTHAALVQLARDRRIFYYYDTVAASGLDKKQRTFQVQNAGEHRLLLASLLRRSRYYFANRARVNQPDFTRGHDEVSGRFYEGSAAGTVLLGDPPDSEVFKQQFDWPDAVIRVPFDSPDIGRILAELDQDPSRLARIGRENARHAAGRHDWLHRLRTVYNTLGIPPTAGMRAREQQLQALVAAPGSGAPRVSAAS